jgi:hypothetical protein
MFPASVRPPLSQESHEYEDKNEHVEMKRRGETELLREDTIPLLVCQPDPTRIDPVQVLAPLQGHFLYRTTQTRGKFRHTFMSK